MPTLILSILKPFIKFSERRKNLRLGSVDDAALGKGLEKDFAVLFFYYTIVKYYDAAAVGLPPD